MKEKTYEKYMKQTSWFHGTTLEKWDQICKHKVRWDYNEGSELDFGWGFYLAPTYSQAENYIKRAIPYMKKDETKIPVVIEFELCLEKIANKYKHTCFLHFNDEFAEFVIMNRNDPTKMYHNYDFIIGVMTDSNPENLINNYRNGIITYEALKKALMKWNSMEQVSLHNREICDILKVNKITLVNNGEKLNIYE